MSQKNIDKSTTSILGRGKNALVLAENGLITITTNIDSASPTIIKLNPETNEILISGGTILVISDSNKNLQQEYSVSYSERLEELLSWMINVLQTHSHPPNAAPIPDFFQKAQNYLNNIKSGWLSNRNFKHK